MKFLCGNCKAKYQIADEKVSGKTLRMKCRRCGHDILIDGHSMPASNPPAAPPPRRAGTASVVPAPARAGSGAQPLPPRPAALGQGLPRPTATRSKPPSALGAEFRRHVAAPPEVPKRTAPYDLWHVAIQDVPVGPMTREELGRKIDAGAVNADSLCWREGMDDWRPLGGLPELSQLLRRTREGSRSRPPPRPRVPPHVPSQQGSRPSQLPPEPEEYDEYSEPTRIADMQSAMAGHASSPKIVIPQQPPAPGGSSSVVMEAPSAAIPTRQKGASALTTGIAVGLLIGILLVGGPMLYRNTWGTPAPAPTQQAAVNPAATQKSTDLAASDIQVDIPAEPEKAHTGGAGKTPRPGVALRPTTKPDGKTKELSDEERRLLERMGQPGGGDINLGDNRPRQAEAAAAGPALTAAQLSKVVQDNKVQLQRCYETALRATGGKQEGAIKVTVNVTVGTSGTSKGVTTQGSGLGNMNDCIKQAVKRWRFPQSGGDSEFAFPLVFQPGA
jgi:predicted Zn finger-like uncharacterized protein